MDTLLFLSREVLTPSWSHLVLWYHAAKFRDLYGTIEERIEAWKHLALLIINNGKMTFDSIVTPEEREWVRLDASSRLSACYFALAVQKRQRQEPTDRPIMELSRLAKTISAISDRRDNEGLIASYPALILGVWLRDYENKEWRQCFESAVDHAFQILLDNNPENDLHGYRSLEKTLLLSGDIKKCKNCVGHEYAAIGASISL